MEFTINFDCNKKIRSFFRRWKQRIIKYVKPKQKDLRMWVLVANTATGVYVFITLFILILILGEKSQNIENLEYNNCTSLTLNNQTTMENSTICEDLRQKLRNSTIDDQLKYYQKQVKGKYTKRN